MPAVYAERQRFDPAHGVQRQRAVKVREQSAAAGGLPFERRAKGINVDRNKNEIALAGEMFRGGLLDLVGCGEMNVAVGEIDRRAGELAHALDRLPRRRVADFVNRCRLRR